MTKRKKQEIMKAIQAIEQNKFLQELENILSSKDHPAGKLSFESFNSQLWNFLCTTPKKKIATLEEQKDVLEYIKKDMDRMSSEDFDKLSTEGHKAAIWL